MQHRPWTRSCWWVVSRHVTRWWVWSRHVCEEEALRCDVHTHAVCRMTTWRTAEIDGRQGLGEPCQARAGSSCNRENNMPSLVLTACSMDDFCAARFWHLRPESNRAEISHINQWLLFGMVFYAYRPVKILYALIQLVIQTPVYRCMQPYQWMGWTEIIHIIFGRL